MNFTVFTDLLCTAILVRLKVIVLRLVIGSKADVVLTLKGFKIFQKTQYEKSDTIIYSFIGK